MIITYLAFCVLRDPDRRGKCETAEKIQRRNSESRKIAEKIQRLSDESRINR